MDALVSRDRYNFAVNTSMDYAPAHCAAKSFRAVGYFACLNTCCRDQRRVEEDVRGGAVVHVRRAVGRRQVVAESHATPSADMAAGPYRPRRPARPHMLSLASI
jgi:hypothetical protein